MIVHEVEQNTEAWNALRLGKPTASNAKKLVQADGRPSSSLVSFAQKLAGDLFAGYDMDAWEGNRYTDRGHEIEDEAAAAYGMRGCELTKVGFVTDDLLRYGASPDRLVDDDGILEIKCLPKNHIPAILRIQATGKPPPDYVSQCHFQMLVTDRKWCDLFYYSQALPTKVCRIMRDEDYLMKLTTGLNKCLAERKRTLDILENM